MFKIHPKLHLWVLLHFLLFSRGYTFHLWRFGNYCIIKLQFAFLNWSLVVKLASLMSTCTRANVSHPVFSPELDTIVSRVCQKTFLSWSQVTRNSKGASIVILLVCIAGASLPVIVSKSAPWGFEILTLWRATPFFSRIPFTTKNWQP